MEKLFDDFPPVSTEQWLETIRKDLKGKDVSALVRKTIDGLEFMPFYRKQDIENFKQLSYSPASFPFLRANKIHNKWLLMHNFYYEGLQDAKRKFEFAQDRDVDIVGLDFIKKYNLSDAELKELINLNKQIFLSAFENIEKAFYQLQDSNLANRVYLNFDPLTYKAFTGGFYNDDFKNDIVSLLNNDNPKIIPLGINLQHYANAGASDMQQIAVALALLAEYFDIATAGGVDLNKIAKNLYLNIAVGSEFFMQIAKIRAVRYLFSKFLSAYDKNFSENTNLQIHSTTLRRNKTIFDSYVNMLRTSIETFAAAVAGSDIISVEPFDIVFRKPDDFSNRIAINQQLVIKHEAFVDKYTDVATGSYYIEVLTKTLIEKSWSLFLEIHKKGGFTKFLENSELYAMIDSVASKEKHLVQTGKITLLGTNKYPNRSENLKDLDIDTPMEISDIKHSSEFPTLNVERLANDFEQLRLKTEKSGIKPQVFLFTYGSVAMRRARADFAGNFFATAGFSIIDNPGFDTLQEGLDMIKKYNPDLVVLCSDDTEYLTMTEFLINEIDADKIVVAGNPADRAEIEAKGVSDFIHVKSNIYLTLKNFQKKLLGQ